MSISKNGNMCITKELEVQSNITARLAKTHTFAMALWRTVRG